ncbi:MAG: pilus assembly protein CpaF, partial [Vallitaleaceae bacterium]|nr:pilus assembly protein CpaF [Vallitaleaceae bacterium]
MLLNSLLIVIILLAVGAFIAFTMKGSSKKHSTYEVDEDKYNMEVLIDFVKNKFNDILKTNLYGMNLSKDEFDKRMKNRTQLRKALKTCSYGDLNAKNYIKSFIRDILVTLYGINEININKIMDFDSVRALTVQDKFEILLYHYKKQHHFHGLEKLIQENGLDHPKELEGSAAYFIEAVDIDEVYSKRIRKLTVFEDKLAIIVQRIYQSYKGYGVVDEIRDMKIDGVSGG